MEEIFLEIQPREEIGRADVKVLRRKGFIPAVVYTQGQKTEPVKIVSREFLRLLHEHHVGSVVVHLKAKDEAEKAKERACLIKEIQYDHVKGDVIHVDFNQISLTKAIKVNVGVVAKAEAIGVKADGGTLEHNLWELEIECLPTAIPKQIEVDVSALKIGDAIHVRDLQLPEGVKILNDPETIILSVAPPAKEEVPLAAVEGEEKLEPEVIKKKEKEAAEEGEEPQPAKEEPKAKEGKEK
jgi:large subunit ribosomal protein L25